MILDLEDAVAPENKARARGVAREVLAGADRSGKPVLVRVNAFDTGLTAGGSRGGAARPALGRGAAQVPGRGRRRAAVALSRRARGARGDRAGDDPDPDGGDRDRRGDARARPARAGRRGPALGHALGRRGPVRRARHRSATATRRGAYTFPFQFARSQCLFAANAHRGDRRSTRSIPTSAIPTGLEREARAGLRDGFTAKAAIHPAQAAIINRVMTPTEDQLDWARQVVALLDGPASRGSTARWSISRTSASPRSCSSAPARLPRPYDGERGARGGAGGLATAR